LGVLAKLNPEDRFSYVVHRTIWAIVAERKAGAQMKAGQITDHTL
jgi:hypothetical protein